MRARSSAFADSLVSVSQFFNRICRATGGFVLWLPDKGGFANSAVICANGAFSNHRTWVHIDASQSSFEQFALSKPSLKLEITSTLRSDNLLSEEKAFLNRWLADSRADDIWSKIEAKIKSNHGDLFASGLKLSFIHEILGGLRIADQPPDAKAMLKQADNAERLAKFLHGPGSKPQPPFLPNSETLIASLMSASRTFREMAQRQIETGMRQVSRIDRNGSRKRGAFSWCVSETLKHFCGQPLDEAAAFLTDLAFPNVETDADQIRSTRRPRIRAGRARPS
jgi:hypothetical protein